MNRDEYKKAGDFYGNVSGGSSAAYAVFEAVTHSLTDIVSSITFGTTTRSFEKVCSLEHYFFASFASSHYSTPDIYERLGRDQLRGSERHRIRERVTACQN